MELDAITPVLHLPVKISPLCEECKHRFGCLTDHELMVKSDRFSISHGWDGLNQSQETKVDAYFDITTMKCALSNRIRDVRKDTYCTAEGGKLHIHDFSLSNKETKIYIYLTGTIYGS